MNVLRHFYPAIIPEELYYKAVNILRRIFSLRQREMQQGNRGMELETLDRDAREFGIVSRGACFNYSSRNRVTLYLKATTRGAEFKILSNYASEEECSWRVVVRFGIAIPLRDNK